MTGIIWLGVAAVLLLGISVAAGIAWWRERKNYLASQSSVQKRIQYFRDQVEKADESRRSVEEAYQHYRSVFRNTHDMVFLHEITGDGLPGRIVDVNRRACEKLGYTTEQFLKMTPLDIQQSGGKQSSPGYSRSDMVVLSDQYMKQRRQKIIERPAKRFISRIREEKNVLTTGEFLARNGQRIPVEIQAQYIDDFSPSLVLLSGHDITDRKRHEQALQESEKRFRTFFAYSPIGIAIYDSQKKLVDVNLACLKMFGVPDSATFASFSIFDNPYVPDEYRKKMAVGETVHFESVIDFKEARRNGELVTTRTDKAYLDIMVSDLGTDQNFRIRGYMAQVQDITQRRKAEESLRESERQLRQAEKLEAIGSMAGGIAHDFNNILTPILGNAQMGMRKCEDGSLMHTFMSEILKASQRAKNLVNQILTFSRRNEKDGAPIHILPIAKEVLKMMKTSMPDSFEIRRVIKAENDVVNADPTQLHQVFMNVCTNAWHSMKEQGQGTLEMRITEFVHESDTHGKMKDLEPGKYIRVSVKDTGHGMDSDTMKHIFEPFFTTKRSGEGTGMGLPVVHSIVASFNGAVTVESGVGEGSTFHIMLPLCEQSEPVTAEETEQSLPGGSESVMVVDDQPEVLRVVTRMIESLGYSPVATASGEDAMKLFKAAPDRFELILADEVMPGMNGHELAQQVFETRPGLPFVIYTGYSDSITEDSVKDMGVRALLVKPLVLHDLAYTLREALDSKALEGES
jgi:PAS domain S-box-containing protein